VKIGQIDPICIIGENFPLLTTKRGRLGEMLISRELITPDQLEQALEEQRRTGELLGRILVRFNFLDEGALLQTIGDQLGVPVVTLNDRNVDPEALSKVPDEFAMRHQLIPLRTDDQTHTLTVAMANPLDVHPLDDLRLVTGYAIQPALASPSEIKRAIEQFYMEKMIQDISGSETDLAMEEAPDIADLQKLASEALVIQLVNLIIHQAVQERASDIHIEPFERELKVRYRIDGVLNEAQTPPKRLHSAIISRIKILAEMNIAERRLPLDGRIRLRVSGRQIDLRVSTIPTMYGESAVMRILDKQTALYGLEELGMAPDTLGRFRRIIAQPYGIVLVTGPTGSGKTTSLYAALNEIFSVEKKIITCEDPVEYQLNGINQIQIRENIGLTFANSLRSIVRQDPDIIMVGEIRDQETAEIAIQAALTGHLVFSTLHTNDAAGAVSRILDMGAEPYLVASSLLGAVAQRLVRKVCQKCKAPTEVDPESLHDIGMTPEQAAITPPMKGVGCEECNRTGYKYRMGVYEQMIVDDDIRQMIVDRTSSTLIRRYAVQNNGMRTLLADGRLKVQQGQTSVEEILRVCQREQV
jgi:type II secretion system protein E